MDESSKKTTKEEMDSIKVEDRQPSFWQIVLSTMAAFLGVQSNKNRVRDFKHGNIYAYIVAGLIFTAIFIGSIVLTIKVILHNAGL